MLTWKLLLKKGGSLGWFTLMLAACTGAGGTESLPTPEPTSVSIGDLPDEVDAGPTRIPADEYADLEIVTLLPRDAIPAIDDPQFLSSSAANDFYDPNELVLGVVFEVDGNAAFTSFSLRLGHLL